MDFQKWDYIDFKTYLLLYCSLLKNIQSKRDRNLIVNSVGEYYLKKHLKQFLLDTGIASRNKIRNYIRNNEITEEEIDILMMEVKDVFTDECLVHREPKFIYQFSKK